MSDGEGDYGNDEHCTIKTLRPLFVTATEFNTEFGYDYLTIAGKRYHGSEGPQELVLVPGDELVWTSDLSTVSTGFKVCAAEASSCGITPALLDFDI